MKTLLVMFMVLVGVMVTSHADGGDGGGAIPLLKRHEIQVLLAAGFPPTGVAERVAREARVDHVDAAAEHRRRKIGRPSKASPFADAVRRWLLEEPDLPTQEQLRRASELGYSGRKSAFYELVALAVLRGQPGPWFASKGFPVSSRSTTSARSTSSPSMGGASASTSSRRGGSTRASSP